MFAYSQIVDAEVRTGTVIVAGSFPPDGNLISLLRLGVREQEIGENGVIAPVFQTIFLLFPILLSELALPFFKVKLFGFVSSGCFYTDRFFAYCPR